MSQSVSQRNSHVGLVGLPGSGKSSFANAWRQAATDIELEQITVPFTSESTELPVVIWCVIDVRSPLQDALSQSYLKQLLAHSDGIVMAFMEASDLDAQSAWQAWLKVALEELGVTLPRYRWFSEQAINTSSLLKWLDKEPKKDSQSIRLADWRQLPSMTEFDFRFDYAQAVSPINLEHLLLGLDASKQNLGMAIWRVEAVIKTTEYVNPVAIEGTPNRWDTYAGELIDGQGHLRIVGFDLDRDWLEGLVSASQLGG